MFLFRSRAMAALLASAAVLASLMQPQAANAGAAKSTSVSAASATADAASAQSGIRVVLGDEILAYNAMHPFMENFHTYVPLRDTLEKMGYLVDYANNRIEYRGRSRGAIDLAAKTLIPDIAGTAPRPLDLKVVKNVTVVSVRALATVLGKTVDWNEAERTVFIDAKVTDAAQKVPVLMYHYIVPKADNPNPKNDAMLNLENFKAGLAYLHDNGYRTVTLEQLEQFVEGKIVLPRKSVVITFDDGYQNNYVYAYPELKKYGFHAAIFLIGARTPKETATFNPKVNTHLSMEEINASKDVFEFHSHTFDLHRKMQFPNGRVRSMVLDPVLLQNDIHTMKMMIDTPYFCYPYGDYDAQAIQVLRSNGYRMAFTVHQGFVKPGDPLMQLDRLTVKNSTDMSLLLTGKKVEPVSPDVSPEDVAPSADGNHPDPAVVPGPSKDGAAAPQAADENP